MPHERLRHALPLLKKFGSFSPIAGVLGLRQVGKTTLLSQQLGVKNCYSLDDIELREEAQNSPKIFLNKISLPAILDEVQKAPEHFDALKLRVDRKRIPGQYYLTGSTEFSSKLGIRESLTGRIAILQLYPLTLAEAHGLPYEPKRVHAPLHHLENRFKSEQATQSLVRGGLPVPLFMRDAALRSLYFDQWIETAILRDLPRIFGRSYDMDISRNILERIGSILREGRIPSLSDFKLDSRKLRKYLSAMESIFLLRRIPCHTEGTGLDRWLFSDGGIAHSLMKTEHGEGATLTLARHFVMNEILANSQYSGQPIHPRYYKSAQAREGIDLVWNEIPIKIIHAPPSKVPLGWYEKPLIGAMKKLGATYGLIVAPVDQPTIPEKGGIAVVPWTYWS